MNPSSTDEGLQDRLGKGWEKEIREFLPCCSIIINAWKLRGHRINCRVPRFGQMGHVGETGAHNPHFKPGKKSNGIAAQGLGGGWKWENDSGQPLGFLWKVTLERDPSSLLAEQQHRC